MIYHNNNKKAFTLAEVLITLGIIGVVAAMTMPSLVANYQKKRTVSQLKAAYTTIAQAFERAQVDHGDMENWGLENFYGQTSNAEAMTKSYVEDYFLPYVKVTKNLGMSSLYKLGYTNTYFLGGKEDSGAVYGSRYVVVLENGTVVALSLDTHCDESHTDSNGDTVCDSQSYYTNPYIIVDINGKQKPNTFGKDLFVMLISNNKFGFYRYAGSEFDRDWLLKACSKGSKESRHCGQLIQYDGWEINYDW